MGYAPCLARTICEQRKIGNMGSYLYADFLSSSNAKSYKLNSSNKAKQQGGTEARLLCKNRVNVTGVDTDFGKGGCMGQNFAH